MQEKFYITKNFLYTLSFFTLLIIIKTLFNYLKKILDNFYKKTHVKCLFPKLKICISLFNDLYFKKFELDSNLKDLFKMFI